jgi:hypothetical protein
MTYTFTQDELYRLINYLFTADLAIAQKSGKNGQFSPENRMRFQGIQPHDLGVIISTVHQLGQGAYINEEDNLYRTDDEIWPRGYQHWVGPYIAETLRNNPELIQKAERVLEEASNPKDGIHSIIEASQDLISDQQMRMACTQSYAHFCWKIAHEIDENEYIKAALIVVNDFEDGEDVDAQNFAGACQVLAPFSYLYSHCSEERLPRDTVNTLLANLQNFNLERRPDTPEMHRTAIHTGVNLICGLHQIHRKASLEYKRLQPTPLFPENSPQDGASL